MLKRYSFYVLVGLFLLLIFRSENNLTELKSSHFQGRLSIYRDAMGVPHIVADNRNALVYGIGYAQAQDRLWTFHFKKRLLEGRVSELFGKDTLPLDRYMRNLNIRNVGVETG
ncbi:MAG: penicillin acylase family protein [Actinobacteria bacterium]|nr:penicillin acylase family protein [Actinomycetota bacterium]